MANFLTLLKIQFLSFFGINKILYSKKKKKVQGLSGLIVLGVAFVGLIGLIAYVYSKMFVLLTTDLIPLMFAYAALINLAFSFFASSSAVYGYKDYQLLASMPIKKSTIVLSKLFFMYLGDLMLSVIIVAVSCITQAEYYSALEFMQYLRLGVMVVFSPCLPMVVSLVLGVIISFISSRFRKRSIVEIICYVLIFAMVFAVGFTSSEADVIVPFEMINKIYFCNFAVIRGLVDWMGVLIFLAMNVIPILCVSVVVILTYAKMNGVLTSTKKVKNFKLKFYRTTGQRKALLVKELKRLFSCAVYSANCLIGSVIAFALLVVFAVILISSKVGYAEDLMVFVPILLSFTLGIAPTTSCSISMEGSSFWQIKTSPVKAGDLLIAKLMVNVLFNTIPALISAILFTIIIGAPFYMVAILALFVIFLSLQSGASGLLINLLFPLMKWDNPNQVVKKSGAVALSMLWCLIITAVLFLIAYYVTLPVVWVMVIITALTGVLAIVFNALVFTKGERLINKKT